MARRAKKNGLDDAAAAKKALHSMNNSALVQATAEGHGETADILLKAGADPNFVDVKNNGSTPLLLACKFNHVAIAKVLEHGGHFTSPVSNQLVCVTCAVLCSCTVCSRC